ncbi:MAG TPA: VOC family protein [Allosphingosinicella sp.]|jgi:catechol 2,3-dioxygenase-like lactoylglutathione lyase family enzyme
MLDHVNLGTGDLERSMAFYEAALAPLGIKRLMERRDDAGRIRVAGYGDDRFPYFWLGRNGPIAGRLHIAFRAPSREAVDAFHAAAMANGGRDNGRPGVRPEYHPGYYGAFALDPDGCNVEAVHHSFA